MTPLMLNRPAPEPSPLLARLTRHLAARLGDYGPAGPEVTRVCQEQGLVSARFPRRSAEDGAAHLARAHDIFAQAQGDEIVFRLNDTIPFEALDFLWACLFDLLDP